ncbi:MAG: glycosyltransferase family 2 protein [Candidatus Omnitrophica bacterium]|nr:glycosyltransferase family 2 protein [Candidatus Omnitrophota bacterium]
MISVIIVNYNKKDLLKRCLDSVRGQGFKDIEIIVVDNASPDDSVEMVRMYYPEAKLIWNTRNLLFCKAYNQGIDASKGNFIVCLNNDVVLDKDYLKEALFAIGLDNRIGMVSGKILRVDKKTIDSAGLFLGKNRKPIERGYGKQDEAQYEKPGYVFGVSGACAFFRRSILMDIKDENGYFDERFGMYYEDLDLCWRAQKKGWKAYYYPKAVAYHVRSATAVGRIGIKKINLPYLTDSLKRMYIKNRYLCMKKNDSLRGILLNLPFIICYEMKIWLYMFFNLALKSSQEIFLDRDKKT